MKKTFSIFFFLLVAALFIFELYFSIAGAIDIDDQLDELASRGAGGHELLGVGLDVFVFAVALTSVVGFVFAIISYKIAQFPAVRTASGIICPLFLTPALISALILTL